MWSIIERGSSWMECPQPWREVAARKGGQVFLSHPQRYLTLEETPTIGVTHSNPPPQDCVACQSPARCPVSALPDRDIKDASHLPLIFKRMASSTPSGQVNDYSLLRNWIFTLSQAELFTRFIVARVMPLPSLRLQSLMVLWVALNLSFVSHQVGRN